jgi:Flp pilus assembly protein TadG
MRRLNNRGQAIVEFALVATVFFLLVFGVIELGRLVYVNHALANATREGARVALVSGSLALSPATEGDIEAVVQDKAVGVNEPQVAVTGLGGSPGEKVTVTATADFTFIVQMVFSGDIQLSHSSEVIIQH